ncbi:MAG: cell division protein CrgA [Acidobacteria bacterium]|nr:cell division protein CrgA [Acidobacteriota bacterium]
MPRPQKRRVEGTGRTTAKGTRPESAQRDLERDATKLAPSPVWVPILMFALLGLGIATIFLNYTEVLPGSANNLFLLGGLGLILAGIITATQYR